MSSLCIIQVTMSTSVSAKSGLPAIHERGRHRTVETLAATITLVGAGSEESESSSSEEYEKNDAVSNTKHITCNYLAASEQTNDVQPGMTDSLLIKSPVHANGSLCNEPKHSHDSSVQGKKDTDCKNEVPVLQLNSAHVVDTSVIPENVGTKKTMDDRFNPFDRDDLSEVIFEHASRDPIPRRKYSEPCKKPDFSSHAGSYIYHYL